MKHIVQYFRDYFRGVSELFFFQHAGPGIGLMVLIAVFSPLAFAHCLLCSAIGQAHAIRYCTPKKITGSGLLPVNGLFFGLAMTYLFKTSSTFYVLLVAGALVLPILTKSFFEVLQHWKLSPLVAPYIACTWFIWLARERLGLQLLDHQLPALLDIKNAVVMSEPLLSAGRLLFLPQVGFGLFLLALITAFDLRRGFYFVLGTLSAVAVAYFIATPNGSMEFGALTACGGLTAISLASSKEKFKIHNIMFFAGLTSFFTLGLETFFMRLDLPILTVPFVFTAWLAQLSRVPRFNVSWAPENVHRRQNISASSPIFMGERAI